MSRTDGHEPYWVFRERYGEVEHDHRDGVCLMCHCRNWQYCECYADGRRPWQSNTCTVYPSGEDEHRYWNNRTTWGKAVAEATKRHNRQQVRMALRRGDWERAEFDTYDHFWWYD